MSSSAALPKELSPKAPPGASWKDNEQQVLPKNRLGIVFFGLMSSVFLAALDQTIVATALPSIVADLGGGSNYGWVGSAYMLSSAALGPVYGKLSVMLGRKPVLYECIFVFLIGSALCGAAQNIEWLIAARAVQGMGGWGTIQVVQIIVTDIVSLEERGKYLGAFGATFGIAGQHASWRWCFWINLPTGGIASVILFFFLNLNPHQVKSFHEHMKEFDFVGLVTVVSGVLCLLLGLHSGETTWKSAETISLIVIGGILLFVFAINEIYTKRSAIIPPRLFKTRTTGVILISVFLHATVFFMGTYYLPMYYQVLGASPTIAGLRMLPYSFVSATQTLLVGFVTHAGSLRPIIWGGWAVMTVGWGLMIMLDYTSNIATQEICPLIAAIGIGSLFQTLLIAIQAAMPLKDVPTSTGALMFMRVLGGTIGITVGETIISSALQRKLRGITGITMGVSPASINNNIKQIPLISNPILRAQVMHAYARSISTVWLVNTILSSVGLVLVVLIRAYLLQRTVIHAGTEKTNDTEKGEEGKRIRDEGEVEEALRSGDDVAEPVSSRKGA